MARKPRTGANPSIGKPTERFDPNNATTNQEWKVSSGVYQAMTFLEDVLTYEVLLYPDPPITRFVQIHGPWGLFKSGRMNELLRLYVAAIELRWSQMSPAERAADPFWDRRTIRASSGLETFRSPIIVFPQHCDEDEFWLCMWDCQYAGEIGVMDECNALNWKRNRAVLAKCTAGTGNAVRRTDFIEGLGKAEIREFNGCIITLDNVDPRSPEGKRMASQQYARGMINRARQINFPFDDAQLAVYIHMVGWPWSVGAGGTGIPDEKELHGWDEVEETDVEGVVRRILRPIDGPENFFQYLRRPKLDSGDPGINSSCSDEEAIKIIEDVRKFYTRYWPAMETIGFRDVQGWIKNRTLYPEDWEARSKSTLLPDKLAEIDKRERGNGQA